MKVQAPEDDVKAAAESVLGVEVHVAGRLNFGEVNSVYRVGTGARSYVLKVFRHADWPERDKLPWIESRLARVGAPHARLIHYTREAGHFPHGFSVSEFVEGENCKAAIRRGRLTPASYFELAGALLNKIHSISLPLYGYIGDGGGMCEDFVGWLLGCDVKDSLQEIDDGTNPAETFYPLIERKIEPTLRRYESCFTPALVHADCTPKNGVLTGDGGLVLVDWDEAIGGFWVKDYANLTYWYSYLRKDGGEPGDGGVDEARASFFRGYGEPGFDDAELREIEWALHVAMASGSMSYLYRTGDVRGHAHTRELLLHLLDSPPAPARRAFTRGTGG